MSLSPYAKRILRKVAAHLRSPESRGQFDMLHWHRRKSLDQGTAILSHLEEGKQIHCGTTHCIAGWVQVLSPKCSPDEIASGEARRALDLTDYQANRLFWMWPQGFGGEHANRKQAAARIDHFIKTGGAE